VTQLRRGVLEHCVLALLEGEQRYGYDLVAQLSGAGLLASEGTMYPLLTRLRKDQLVETTWQESPNGPPRRYYSLTSRGKEALSAFRVSWAEFAGAVDRTTPARPGLSLPAGRRGPGAATRPG
jgi:PadR family transcriptional regulator, regulatory protein PadR